MNYYLLFKYFRYSLPNEAVARLLRYRWIGVHPTKHQTQVTDLMTLRLKGHSEPTTDSRATAGAAMSNFVAEDVVMLGKNKISPEHLNISQHSTIIFV